MAKDLHVKAKLGAAVYGTKVHSVNGKAGHVVLTPEDIGALPEDTDLTDLGFEKPDWNEDDPESAAYIENKPSIRAGSGMSSIEEGHSTNVASASYAHAEGYGTSASDISAHAEGNQTQAVGSYSHAEGYKSKTSNTSAHAEGNMTTAGGQHSHAEGYRTEARDYASHAEGNQTVANGQNSHAEGQTSNTSAQAAHAEGAGTKATGPYSHAEGSATEANGQASHAEGETTKANGGRAHAEGWSTEASAPNSHAEGARTKATGNAAHAEGLGSTAQGQNSHAEGEGTKAIGNWQHVEGKYNTPDDNNSYIHIAGNGNQDSNRSNAHTLDWDGNAWYAGRVSAGTQGAPADPAEDNDLVTKHYLDQTISGKTDKTAAGRVTAIEQTPTISPETFEVAGIPTYISDPSAYPTYGLTEAGWYAFASIRPKDGTTVDASQITVSGAAGYTVEADCIYAAIKFDVAALSQPVTINWGTYTETIIFKATDLAVRNLDYRVTFYVYDADQFATWEYARTENQTFVGTKYYTEENGVYTQAAVKALKDIPEDTYYTHAYVLTEDTVFEADKTYYTKTITPHSTYGETGMVTWNETTYDAAEVTVGDDVTTNTYYEDQWTAAAGYFVGTAYYTEDDGEYTQIAVKAGEIESYFTKQVDFEPTVDETYVGTEYWEVDAESDLGYSRAAVKAGFEAPAEPSSYYTHSYLKLTAAGHFAADTRYYKLIDGEYVLQEVTAGASYAKNVYYIDQWTIVEAGTALVGTRYYVQDVSAPEGYAQAAVVAGEAVQAGTCIRIVSWPQATDPTFEAGETYYINPTGQEYVAATVQAGDPIPVYYSHSNLTFEGLTRNVTYRFNQFVDCPTTFVLPEIEDETHGCWFELRLRHAGRYSTTLVPPTDDIKIATEHTQAETAGINMVNLHYTVIGGVKVWRFMNTHSTVPA